MKDKFKKLQYEYMPTEKEQLERTVTKKIQAYLKDKPGVWHFKNHIGMGMNRAGVPDIICCINGVFLAIEVKKKSGRLTAIQEHCIEQIEKKGGGSTIVAYGYEDFVNKFEDIYYFGTNLKE